MNYLYATATVITTACAVFIAYLLAESTITENNHPCILPGTIREVEVNGVVWRGEPCDTAGACIRYAKPVKGGR